MKDSFFLVVLYRSFKNLGTGITRQSYDLRLQNFLGLLSYQTKLLVEKNYSAGTGFLLGGKVLGIVNRRSLGNNAQSGLRFFSDCYFRGDNYL